MKKPGEFRIGKTKKDRQNGSHARCIENKAIRADWQNDSKHGPMYEVAHTCNGKRNRYSGAKAI